MITFNGVNLSDYVIIMDIRRDISPPKELVMQSVTGMKGSYLTRVETLSREVEVDVFFKEKTLPELRKAVRAFSGIINTDTPKKIVFADEPDVYYYGILTGESSIQEIISYGKATLTFKLPDPIAWGSSKVKSLNVQTDAAEYYRESTAIDPEGIEVAANTPRFGTGKFGKALLLEDETVNIIPDPKNMGAYSYASYTVDDTLSKIVDGVAAINFVRDQGTGDIRLSTPIMEINPSMSYVYSFEIKHVAGIIEMQMEGKVVSSKATGVREIGAFSGLGVFTPLKEVSVLSVKDLADGFKRYSLLIPSGFFYKATGTTAFIENRHGYTENGSHEYLFRKPQLEINKETPSSFTVGERKKELLKIAVSNNISGAAGTWEQRFKYAKNDYPVTDSVERYIWNIKTVSGSNAISLGIKSGVCGVTVGTTVYPISLAEGWNDVAVAWTATSLLIVVNGVAAHTIADIIISNNFGGYAYIGANEAGPQANTFHDSVRLSDVARTLAAIKATYNKVWAVDGSTSMLMSFNGNLDQQSGEYSEVNTLTVGGTTRPSPVFTIKSLSNAAEFKITLDTGEFLRVETAIKAKDVIIIDCTKNSLTINGKRALEFLDLDSIFFDLNLGVNTVNLTEGLTAEITIAYVERWS